jgi:hypothetical protein
MKVNGITTVMKRTGARKNRMEAYLKCWNSFDVQETLKELHLGVLIQNVAGGDITANAKGNQFVNRVFFIPMIACGTIRYFLNAAVIFLDALRKELFGIVALFIDLMGNNCDLKAKS